MSTLAPSTMSEKDDTNGLVLSMDAGGEFAAGATVLAAYWPRGDSAQIRLRSHPGGKRELLIPLQPHVIEKALAVLSEWAHLRTGVSTSARLLHQRIRSEAARASLHTRA